MASTSLSTYTSYLIVNRDLKSSLSTVANQSTVKRDTEYYEANIGKVTSVDEFLDDYRLYSYAMKAYGLEDMTYGKAFMRKVLESDLSDSSSFANTLTDKRYLQFAETFNFNGDAKTAQNKAQVTSLTDAYKESFTTEETNIKAENTYFAAQIGNVTSVDDLINNARLRTYILDAVGLDSTYTSKSYLKQVLTSDLDDEDSVANQAKNKAWKQLAEYFNFKTDGTFESAAQTSDQTEDLSLDYIASKSTYPSNTLLAANQRYWEKNVTKVATASELTADSRLLAYAKTAFGLSNTIMASSVASLMSSQTFAETYGNTKLLDYFNFETDGTLTDGATAQDSTQTTNLAKLYKTAFTKDQTTAIDEAVSNYESRITSFTNLDDFFVSNEDDDDKNNDDVTEVWDVALRAFGIDPDEVSKSELKKILSSDLNDRKSYVNTLGDDRFVELAKAFNFTSDGDVEAPLLAQSESMTNLLATDYKANKLRSLTGAERKTASDKADAEIEYYKLKMMGTTSVNDLVADSRVTNFILEAHGIDPESVTTSDLKKMFKSDLSDPDSFVNTQDNSAYAQIVASFNFNAEGELDSTASVGAQQRGGILQTTSQYARQTLEEQQGDSNAGVRLALYFERKAPDITSAYGVLSDDAIFEFFKTAYSLPDTIANMDVTKQAEMVTKFMDLSKFQDQDYLDELIKRFTALYDTKNSNSSSPALTILSGSSTSISADTLLAVAQLSSK